VHVTTFLRSDVYATQRSQLARQLGFIQ
jgi:predicted transcriptional regulator